MRSLELLAWVREVVFLLPPLYVRAPGLDAAEADACGIHPSSRVAPYPNLKTGALPKQRSLPVRTATNRRSTIRASGLACSLNLALLIGVVCPLTPTCPSRRGSRENHALELPVEAHHAPGGAGAGSRRARSASFDGRLRGGHFQLLRQGHGERKA